MEICYIGYAAGVSLVGSWTFLCVTSSPLFQVIGRANGVKYGLAACVWSRDVGRVHNVAHELQVGCVLHFYSPWIYRVAGASSHGVLVAAARLCVVQPWPVACVEAIRVTWSLVA